MCPSGLFLRALDTIAPTRRRTLSVLRQAQVARALPPLRIVADHARGSAYSAFGRLMIGMGEMFLLVADRHRRRGACGWDRVSTIRCRRAGLALRWPGYVTTQARCGPAACLRHVRADPATDPQQLPRPGAVKVFTRGVAGPEASPSGSSITRRCQEDRRFRSYGLVRDLERRTVFRPCLAHLRAGELLPAPPERSG